MQRVTISIDDDILATLDKLCERRGYTSRSEAIRDLVRHAETHEHATRHSHEPCVATLSYVYEHETRDLAQRLTSGQHDHHELSVATLHVHLNHEDCLEVAVLRGSVEAVQGFADTVTTQRGVRHGYLHIVPAPEAPHEHHDHAHKTHKHG